MRCASYREPLLNQTELDWAILVPVAVVATKAVLKWPPHLWRMGVQKVAPWQLIHPQLSSNPRPD
jgi:hypothetical protein